MTLKVTEAGVLGLVTGKKVWYSRLIASGLGSSAYYPSSVLENTGALAFPVGTHMHADHQSWREWDEQPANSIKTIVGVIASEPKFHRVGETVTVGDESIVIDTEGLYALTEYVDEWAPFVEQIGKYLGLSVNVQCTVEETEHESGKPIVESFVASPLNTVDVVTAPGAKGRIIKAVESFHDTINPSNMQTREDTGMTPEEIEKVAEALAKALTPVLTEALKPVEPEEPNEEESVKPSDVAEALIKADLPEAARKKVYESVDGGKTIEEAIQAEQEYIKGITEGLDSDNSDRGTVKTSEAAKAEDYTIAGW